MADATFIAFGDMAADSSEMRILPQVLRKGETPICAIHGSFTIGLGLLVATDKRLFFLTSVSLLTLFSDRPARPTTHTFRYQDLSAVEWDTGFMWGSLTFCERVKARKGTRKVTQLDMSGSVTLRERVKYHTVTHKVAQLDKKYARYFASYLEIRIAQENKKYAGYFPNYLKARMIGNDVDAMLSNAVSDGAKTMRLSELAQQQKKKR